LLQHLYRHAVNENFTWRLSWRKGTLAIWDNRCTQHFAMNDYQGFRREMVRTSVKGSEPQRAA
jgi:taurine dioxygenase